MKKILFSISMFVLPMKVVNAESLNGLVCGKVSIGNQLPNTQLPNTQYPTECNWVGFPSDYAAFIPYSPITYSSPVFQMRELKIKNPLTIEFPVIKFSLLRGISCSNYNIMLNTFIYKLRDGGRQEVISDWSQVISPLIIKVSYSQSSYVDKYGDSTCVPSVPKVNLFSPVDKGIYYIKNDIYNLSTSRFIRASQKLFQTHLHVDSTTPVLK